MAKMSRDKGKRGERELAKELSRLFNVNAQRGQQYQGSPDSPDVKAFDEIHIECKRVERFDLYKSLEQAKDDAGDSLPIVAHRRNRHEWVVALYLDDLPELSRILTKYVRKS